MPKCIYFLCIKSLQFAKQDTIHGHLCIICQNFGELQNIQNQKLKLITIILVDFHVERDPNETDCEGSKAGLDEKEFWKIFHSDEPNLKTVSTVQKQNKV